MMLGLKNRLLTVEMVCASVFCALSPFASAQTNQESRTPTNRKQSIPAGIELGLGMGYVLPHRNLMQHLVTDHSKRMSVAYGKQIVGGWTEGRHPEGTHWSGIELAWTELGGAALGSIVSGLWLNRFPGSKWGYGELGIGVGRSSRPWDPIDAPSSVAMSTHWNAGLHAAWCISVFDGQRSAWTIKTRFTHFSNGALSLPNLGINNFGIDLNHQWRENHQVQKHTLKAFNPKTRIPFTLEMSLRGGARDVGLPGGPLHPILNLHLLGHHKIKRAQSVGWAVAHDIGYNQSLRVTRAATGAVPPLGRTQWAVLGGLRWDFNRIQVTALQGWMLTNPDLELGHAHLMVTMHYKVNSAIAVELGLKSFQFRADYPFIGIQHQFGRIRKLKFNGSRK